MSEPSPSQVDRATRRASASPYSRQVKPARNNTPSRFGGLISTLLSPFRSSPKPQLEEDDSADDYSELDAGLDSDREGEQSPEQYALVGRSLNHPPLDGLAPPSPTPARHSQYLSPNLLTSSYPSLPDLASATSTPRFPGTFASPRRSHDDHQFSVSPPRVAEAEEELARFFREREARGNPPLTAFEHAGVAELSKRIAEGAASAGPTAFSPGFSYQSFNRAATPTLRGSTSLSSIFAAPSPAASTSGLNDSGLPFRRRRPLYVGAGYSSQSARRRKQATSGGAIFAGMDGLKRSQSEGAFPVSTPESEDKSSVAEGKRRRTDDDDDNDGPPAGMKKSAPTGSLAIPSPAVVPKVAAIVTPKPKVVSTPVRPSPLWQVSKAADTPSPSPPKKQPPTRAADLIFGVIREVDETKPKPVHAAILNPYDNNDDAISRVPRSRPTPRAGTSSTARKTASTRAGTQAAAAKISPLEELERSMPPEYRQDAKRVRRASSPASSAPSPPPVVAAPPTAAAAGSIPPKKKQTAKGGPAKAPPTKKVEVIEVSDSDDDSDAAPPPPPKAAASKTKRPAPSPTPAVVVDARPQPATSNIRSAAPASSFLFTPPHGAPSSSSSVAPVLPPSSPTSSPKPRASLPPPMALPTNPSFSFTVTSPAQPIAPPLLSPKSVLPYSSSSGEGGMTEAEARSQARHANRTILPTFGFEGLGGKGREEEGEGEGGEEGRSVRSVVREMERGELPIFVL